MQNKNRSSVIRLAECSVMLALAIALNFVTVWRLPMGGKVTLLSMLPILLLAVKYPVKYSLPTAFVFALWQLGEGFVSGNVFPYCKTPLTVIIVVAFDYLLPFTCLGLAGLFKNIGNKNSTAGIITGVTVTVVFRFICHFVTGFSIWGQWANEGQSKYVYSLLYNGQYMLPELIFTLIGAVILLKIPRIRFLLGINDNSDAVNKAKK